METINYTRRVNYYETDQMAIVHHSNYIRYFEESRLNYMRTVGCDCKWLESEGIIIPNVDAYAKYISTLKFDDEFTVCPKPVFFNGVRIKFEYKITAAETGALVCEGSTTHCFVNDRFKPLSLKKARPDIYELILSRMGGFLEQAK